MSPDDYWECVIRHNTYTIYHVVGTCKMCPVEDPKQVMTGTTFWNDYLFAKR